MPSLGSAARGLGGRGRLWCWGRVCGGGLLWRVCRLCLRRWRGRGRLGRRGWLLGMLGCVRLVWTGGGREREGVSIICYLKSGEWACDWCCWGLKIKLKLEIIFKIRWRERWVWVWVWGRGSGGRFFTSGARAASV